MTVTELPTPPACPAWCEEPHTAAWDIVNEQARGVEAFRYCRAMFHAGPGVEIWLERRTWIDTARLSLPLADEVTFEVGDVALENAEQAAAVAAGIGHALWMATRQ